MKMIGAGGRDAEQERLSLGKASKLRDATELPRKSFRQPARFLRATFLLSRQSLNVDPNVSIQPVLILLARSIEIEPSRHRNGTEMAQISSIAPPSPFLRLPLEIRLETYRFIFHDTSNL